MFSKPSYTIRLAAVFAFVLLAGAASRAQIMPVGANVVMTPPAPGFLADYYGVGSTAFRAFVTLNDLNEPDWNVRLIVRVEGQGIIIETKPTFIPAAPINLISGVPTQLEGDDFAQYLNVNNVNLSGITAASLNQNGKLPEGLYQFCVTVLDYQTGTPLSHPSCGTAFIFYENPPILLIPECETALQPSDPQNIFFHWQIAGGASPTIAATSQYKLFVYELQDENEDPYYAVQNNKALLIYESEYTQTTSQTIDFGISNSAPLVAGKRYIYRVRALDADGKNIYKNDGYSEFCWFFYGYPSDGVISLTQPQDAHIFSKTENPYFQWTTSDKGVAGQEYEYILVFNEKNPGQTKEQAIENSPEWLSVNLPPSTSLNGYDYLLTQPLETGKNYVWQVKAMTGTQQVAASPVYEFFAPSLMDEFYAGNTAVKVLSLTNFTKTGNRYTGVEGLGRIQLSDDPQDVIDVEFNNLTIDDLAGTFVLTQGSFTFDMSQRPAKVLAPVEEVNGEARFAYTSGQVNSQGLKIGGQIEWPFPHATTSGALEYIRSAEQLFTLNSSYTLNGSATLGQPVELELLEPYEVQMSFDGNSQINLNNDKFSLSLNGSLTANDNVRTNNGERYSIRLNQQNQLDYFTATNLLMFAGNYLEPIEGLNIGFMPKRAIVDLSEDQSPDKMANNLAWKGIYFPEFQVRMFQQGFDATNQLTIPENFDYHEDLTTHDFWITNQGLRLNYTFTNDTEGIRFNGFKTPITAVLDITNNETSTSKFTGDIAIYVISEEERFSFEVPVVTAGVQQGYLNQDLTLRDIVFNPFGGENRVNVTINRAVFADNERLDLEIDAELVGFNTTVTGIDDFRIYGDNVIGVGARNGSKALTNRVAGTYHDYDAFITEVGASLFDGNFVFSYKAEMDLGSDVAGENGPPVLDVSSVTPAGSSVELPSYSVGNELPTPSIPVPDPQESANSQTLTSTEMLISVNNSIVEIEGYLKLRSNDPVWGNSFAGGINGKIKIPTEIEAGANMILGVKDDVDFWYFDAWFNDTQGMGLSVAPLFNIVAMEGRIFRHMSKQDGEFMIDPNMAFGGALFMQLIDQSGGRLFATDIGAELKVFEDGEFTLSMSGDVSVLNTNGRTAANGSITSAVGEELVEAAAEMVGPISLSVPLAGGTLTIEAEGLTGGSIGFTKDDYSIGLGVDAGSTPGVDFEFAKGGTSFNIGADATGTFELGVGFDGDHVNIGVSKGNGGSLDLAVSGVTVGLAFNKTQKSGSLNVGYGDQAIGIGISQNSGYLDLQLAADKKFSAGYSSAGSAHIGLQYGSTNILVAGDKASRSGRLELSVDGVDFVIAGNGEEKSAEFELNAGGFEIGLSGQYGVGGAFHLLAGDVEVDVAADLEANTGLLAFAFDGGNKAFSAELDGSDKGALTFKNGSTEFGISGNADGSAGSVMFKDGSNEFEIAADRNAGTGSLTLLIGGEGIESSVSPDTSFVSFTVGGVSLDAGVNAQGAGGFAFANGGDSFSIFGNPETQTGSLALSFSGNTLALSTNLPDNEHSILVDAGGVLFDAKSSDTEKSLELGYQSYNFKVSAGESASGGGGTAGSISVTDGTNTFALAADPDAGTGSLTVDLGGNGVTSAIESDTAYLNFAYDGYSFKTGISESGNGGVFYSDGSNSFGFEANPSAQTGSIDLDFSGNQLSVSTDIPNNNHAISIQSSGVEFSASSTGSDKEISASYSGYAVSAKKTGSDYEVALDLDGRSLRGGLIGNAPEFGYNGDGLELEIASNKVRLAKNGHSLEVTDTDILIDGSTVQSIVSNATTSYTQQIDGLSATIALNAGEYTLSFSHSGKSFIVTTSDFQDGSMELGVNGNTYGLARDNGKYTVTVNDVVASYESGTITVENGEARKLSIASSGVNVEYDGYTFGITPSSLNYSDGTNSASLSAEGLQLQRDDNELFVSDEEFGLQVGSNKRLALTRNSIDVDYDDFSLSYEAGESITASIGEYSMGYDDSKLTLKQGTARSLEVSEEGVDVSFDGYSFGATPTSFTYTDGTNSASISEDGLELARGDNELFISDEAFGIRIGESKSVSVTSSSLAVQYDNYTASFSAGESLSFSDGTRSFALSNDGLEMADGDKSIAVFDDNGLPGIRLTNGADLFELSQSGFAIEYDGKRYAVNETENLTVEIDETRSLQLMSNGLKYVEGSYEFIIGGDENVVELKEGESRSIALTNDDKLVVRDGSYYGSLSKDLEVVLTDGERRFALMEGDNYLSYSQDGYDFNITGANGADPGLSFSNGDFGFAVSGQKNSNVSVAVTHSSFGTISASVESTKDMQLLMQSSASSVYGFIVDNGSISMVNGSMPQPPTPEHLDGAPTIPAQDGPQHLTNSIADDAGGAIRGEANIFFDSRQKRFMMTAAVAGNSPVCIKGAMAMDVSPGQFHLDIGTEQQRVEIFPTCSGFGGGGWFGIHNANVDVGVFAAWRASASVSIGTDAVGASLSAEAGAELGVRANLTLDPFKINNAGVWVELYAGLYASYWFLGSSGSLTIAEIRLRGDLMVYFEAKTRVTGSLSGSIIILDIIEEDFDMSFNTTF
jgi:hypothetical protein